MSQSRVFKSGRLTINTTANQRRSTIPDNIKALLGQLYMDMAVLKQNIEAYDKRRASGVPVAAQRLITPYCESILHFADTYKVGRGRVTRNAKATVDRLHKNLMQFDSQYSKLQHHEKITPALHAIVCELNSAILWFVRQYAIVINSYPVTNRVPVNGSQQDWDNFIKAETFTLRGLGAQKVMHNRPKNWAVREIFRTLTLQYQQTHGLNKFIPFKLFSRALVSINKQNANHANKALDLSEKSYYHFKKAWKDRTFDNII
jgi:hypothetical protein